MRERTEAIQVVPLTQGKEAIIDAQDLRLVTGLKWQAQKAHRTDTWYAATYRDRGDGEFRAVYMHRLILGVTDPKIKVDHKNHDGLNNTRSNIRACTHQENSRNQNPIRNAPNKTSRFKGVYRGECAWVARIGINGKSTNIGSFRDEVDAAKAYDAAAVNIYGEFAATNFPIK